MSINQTAFGSYNNQTTKIFNRPLDPVDICADKIGIVLATIANIDFFQSPKNRLVPPDIYLKNNANNVDSANSVEIDKTYALWDEITSAISADVSGTTAGDYDRAAFILNQVSVVSG